MNTADIQDIFPLSPMQEGILFHSIMNHHSNAYFEQFDFTVEGYVDVECLQEAMNKVIAHYDILRTIFIYQNVAKPRQVVLKKRDSHIHFEDISHLPASGIGPFIEQFKADDQAKGFEISKDVLLRMSIFRVGEQSYRFVWSYHHIIMDGWCRGIIIDALFECYKALLHNRPILLEKTQPYSSYIKWLGKRDKKEALQYWKTHLQDYEQQAELPFSGRKGAEEGYRPGEVRLLLDREVTQGLVQLAKENHVTLNTVFQALWGLMLQRYNDTDDVVFGSVVSGRPAEIHGIESMVGLFINTVPVRIQAEQLPFSQWVRQIQKRSVASEAYSYSPLYEIQAESRLKQELIHHIMVFENFPLQREMEQAKSVGFSIEHVSTIEKTNYDLTIIVEPAEEVLIKFCYNANQYDNESMQRVADHLMQAAKAVLEQPDMKAEDIDLMTKSEKRQLLVEFNDTVAEYPKDATIPQLFEEQVRKTPDHIAVVSEDGKLTYLELNERANRLARVLRAKGVQAGSIVGLMIERSLEMMIGIFGILKAGGAYLPIDPSYPQERIEYLLKDSGTSMLLLSQSLKERVEFSGTALSLDAQELCEGDGSNLEPVPFSGNLAYIIYTSGSTGNPKGVMVEHHSVVNRILWMQKRYPLEEQDVILQKTPISFDVSVWELFWWSWTGAKVCLLPPGGEKDPRTIVQAIERHQVTTMHFVPSMLHVFLESVALRQEANRLCCLRRVFTSGEALHAKHGERFRELLYQVNGTTLHNLYGPTEATVDVSFYDCPMDETITQIPIGKPIDNIRLYIVNRQGRMQGIGMPGELCIAGVGVARGYLHRPDLTEEKFVANPFVPGECMYRTGDLARWLPDGNIEYLGRIDHQVKIRGNRIELGEIEARLLQIPLLKEAVVMARQDQEGNYYLSAYFVTEEELEILDVRKQLSQTLPGYMIPSYFVRLDCMPLTSNGKVDRKALPEPEGSLGTGREYIAPRSLPEEQLAGIWQAVLGVERIGVRDNFFELGGHSLKATALVARIHQQLQVEVPLREVFQFPTIEGLARVMAGMEKNVHASIQPAEERDTYPVSSAQKRLYILQQLEGAEQGYNMPAALLVEGPLERERFEQTVAQLVGRHEALRTSFVLVNGAPVQRIHQHAEAEVSFLETNESEVEVYIRPFVRSFDLSRAPLLRVALLRIKEDRHMLLFDMHHIISDGVSMNVLVEEFAKLYEEEELQPLRIQYKDYAVWQQDWMQSGRYKAQERYWLEQMSGELPVLELPTDYPRPAVKSFKGEQVGFTLDAEMTQELHRMAKERGSTLYMVLLAAYSAFLSRYSGQSEIVIGSPIAGRPHADLERVMGMFVNTVALRSFPDGEKTFEAYLQEIKQTALHAYEHADYPFEELVEKLDMPRDLSRNPVFDAMFVLQNTERQTLQTKDLWVIPYSMPQATAKFDLTLQAVEEGDVIECSLEYSTALFSRETIQRWTRHFTQLLKAIVEAPKMELSKLEMLSEAEKRQLLVQFNDTASEYAKDTTIHRLFEEQAEKTPDHIAVVFEDQRLTYRELNEQANQLARTLRTKAVRPESVVGLMVERSLEMIVGILGILKAGGAYLPIDPEYPQERIHYMLSNSGAELVVTRKQLGPITDVPALYFDDSTIAQQRIDNVNVYPDSHNLAYLIYTSGTTGKPKGVMIEHRGILNTIQWKVTAYDYRDARVLMLNPFVFDSFVTHFFAPIVSGATVYFLKEQEGKDPLWIKRVIRENKITHLQSPPSFYSALLEGMSAEDLQSVRNMVVAGEKVSKVLVETIRAFNPYIEIVNEYGPTENSVITSSLQIKGTPELITIGMPIANTSVYILGKHHEIQPLGIAGELYISGRGLARGYLHDAELTAQKFVANPFIPGENMYRTGDQARWLPNGEIEYLGRIDYQVKIRGFRIELWEIEDRLVTYNGIKEAVVVDREDRHGTRSLCAYYVAPGGALQVADLRKHVSEALPEYMVPSYFVRLETMPLTSNGKVDRKALPEPEGSLETGREYIAPRSQLEEQLTGIWQAVLGVERIGVRDNFFELGGHSLKATSLIAHIHQQLQIEVPLREVFQFPTIEGLAIVMSGMEKNAHASIQPAGDRDTYPVSSAQKRLYILQQLEGAEQGYNMPAALLVEGSLERERFEQTIAQLVGRHEALRTSFMLVNGAPVQQIHQHAEAEISFLETNENEAEAYIRAFVRPFDLSRAPLLRVALLRIKEDRYMLLFDMHHIISDGVSMNVLVEEFAKLYEGEELPPLRIQYKDYAVWQQDWMQSGRYKAQERYWLEKMSGELPVLELPTDYPRPAVKSFKGEQVGFTLDAEMTRELHRVAREHGSTLYMVLLAAYSAFLSRYSGQSEIVVGSPIAGRQHADLERVLGMFVNTVALRSFPDGEKTFEAYLQEVKQTALQAYEHAEYPFEELVEKLDVPRDLSRNPVFDAMFVLQNVEQGELDIEGLQLKPYPSEYSVAKFDLTLNGAEVAETIVCSMEYATALYKRETVERMAKHFVQFIDVIVGDPQTKLSSVEIITPQEKVQILEVWGDTAADYPQEKTIHELFEEQAERTPEQVAVVGEGGQLTYHELNEQANRLARTLRAEGVQADEPVGIMVERSLEMIVGIFGILKAGGAYVPIDPEYPEERISYMLEDSGAKLLLLQGHLRQRASFAGKSVELDDAGAYSEDGSNLKAVTGAKDMAYVIYTSGTTGKPKGVMVEHGSVINRLLWMQKKYPIDETDTILQKTAITFDVSVWELFWWALTGAKVCLLPVGGEKNPAVILDTITEQNITTVHFVPSMLHAFLEYTQQRPYQERRHKLASLRRVFASGEALTTSQVAGFHRFIAPVNKAQMINLYGPTEATVDVTYFDCLAGETFTSIPIGKPIDNTQIYIVNPQNQQQPIGVAGELCIAGAGLARGYLNRPELTAEKFVNNPFLPSERMYRTGDLARWMSDGNIEYLGRIDHQVKIRGYRIELGEVEVQLLKAESVREAVVVAREDGIGQKALCAYFVADRELTVSELRGALSQEMPSYMIPSYFVQLERMPLTMNGKLDRKALPAPGGSMQTGTEYVAPQTSVEKTLISIWQAVLGSQPIGVLDNYFDLGGDSIKSLQISSRLYQEGYKLELKDLFKYPTVTELSQHIQPVSRIADQGEVKGEARLTPIQSWFFEQKFDDPHHFNQAVMLYRKEGFDETSLRKVMQKITVHHDALRMVFRQTESGYKAWNRGMEEGELFDFEVLNLREEIDCAQKIEAIANEIQSSIDISEGPLMKLGLFQCAEGDHLLIAIHHLAVDGVSWRILFEDIATGYEQAVNGQDIRFPEKTDSFRSWTEQLAAYANSQAMENERDFWKYIAQIENNPLPRDYEQDDARVRDNETITVQWTREETEQLLKQAHWAYNTEMNDLLLTALGMAIHTWTGMDQVLVNLEGHGRESIIPNLDITRTVGWFTSQYPVVLEMRAGKDMSYRIKRVKEDLRQIPQKGIGYGILRYLSEHRDIRFGVEPEISFNYLGQFDQDLRNNAMQISPYSIGETVSKNKARSYVLDLNGMITGGELSLTISYSGKEYRRETIEQLAGLLRASLQKVIVHCVAKERTELTPSDVLLKGLTVEELEQLTEQTRHAGEIENVYTLTPMQKGMLFHSLVNPQLGAYFEQTTFTLQGTFDAIAFEKSLNVLVQRNEVLRTNFYSGWKEQPVQVVYRKKCAEFLYEDLREMNGEQCESYIVTLTSGDKARGFDLAQDALMRVFILRTGDETYRFLWSFHHILMDGWCLSLVAKEVFEIYFAYQKQSQPELAPVRPYSSYIEWLEKQDGEAASRYWNDYLEGYEHQTVLGKAEPQRKAAGFVLEKRICSLSEQLSQRINQVAKQQKVTVNTLMQTAWGILLQKYNDNQDVVFGSVVSGRPTEVQGIENIIGLFINTIPVRIRCEAEATVAEVMRKIQKQALASHEYDTYPLYEIQAQTEQKQSLINHIMVFENYPVQQQMEQLGSSSSTSFEIVNVDTVEQTNYDFNLIVVPGTEIGIRLEYNACVYDQASVKRIGGHLVHIMEQIVNNPQIAVKEIELLTEEEKTQILEVWGNTAANYPREKTIHQLFEEQVEKVPHQVAVVFENKQLTYRELNEKANRLARTLRAEGVGPDQAVGIIVERSLEMIVGILAILKAGGAYVPINPEYPEERIRYMIEDSGAKLLLLQSHLRERVSFAGTLVVLDDTHATVEDGSNLEPIVCPNNLIYILYTSGTTGQPKGVMIEHQSVVNIVCWFSDKFFERMNHKMILMAEYTFDPSVEQIFGTLLNGATLHCIRKDTIWNKQYLLDYITANEINVLNISPALMQELLADEDKIACLNILICGGEQLDDSLKDKIVRKGYELHNHYGPTETTIEVIAGECEEHTRVSLGKPISNTAVYILNKHRQLQPVGVVGELFIAGDSLARGYLNRSELTAEKFVANPFALGKRMYQTGDFARWLPDGTIEYLGRADNQVKVRGHRIETGEIVSQLLKDPGVKQAAMVVRDNLEGQKELYAYVIIENGLTVTDIRSALAKNLPSYMMPSYFVRLDEMPLTSNRKVNYRKLLEMDNLLDTGRDYVTPMTRMEAELVRIWQDVLGLEHVGIHDNFYEIGGHSLRMIQVISKIYAELSIEIPFVFEAQTIKDMAKQMLVSETNANFEKSVTVMNQEGHTNLFCFPPIIGLGYIYKRIAELLNEQATVYSFNFVHEENLIEHYINHILEIQPEGPFVLVGYSAGGNVAFEVAKALENLDHEVSDLILIDSIRKDEIMIQADDEIDREVQQVIDEFAVKQKLDVTLLKDKAGQRYKSYRKYFNLLTNTECIHADIHFIRAQQSEQVELWFEQASWKDTTTVSFTEYKGHGSHMDMMDEPYISKNMESIDVILQKIRSRKHENQFTV
ncbi:amino acid adenylation domain-containing protein [Brevibacillus laterosporus]|nr:non-ribosomal peptide synthase/polyketide synthase [Brevibacillus laterosporus]TPG89204.1 amino acid adenylation domain-containing protein [Brevibacillus laterosporus]